MRLAIIVVTYQAERFVPGLFASLEQYTDLNDVEIVVVDNASSDGTMEELRRVSRDWQNVHLLPQTENTGFAKGNNLGLRRARELGADYALLLNQDVEVSQGWLPPLREVMNGRPEMAAAQPMVLLYDQPNLINTAGNLIHFCGFGYCGAYRQSVEATDFDPEVRSVAYASGAALMLRMDALERVGGFDEKFFMYHEDLDLQIRLRQRGYECVVVPASRVFHKYTARFSGWKYALMERNRWLVLLKDWPTERLLISLPALVGVELAVLFFSMRQGWLRDKLRTYGEVLRWMPSTVRERRRVQMSRSQHATDGDYLTGSMSFEGLDHPLVTRVANPALSAYWSLARGLFRVR